MKILRHSVHPFLFAMYPVLALFEHNFGLVLVADIMRPLFIAITVSGVLAFLLKLLAKDEHRAGLATSLLLLIFFSFGHAHNFLSVQFSNRWFSRPDVLLAIWGACIVVFPWFSLRIITKKAARGITPVLNIMGGVLLVIVLASIGLRIIQNISTGDAKLIESEELPVLQVQTQKEKPDVYYLIVDMYGRNDVLQEMFGVDQSAFIEDLREQGFSVVPNSTSNYNQTMLSISSSLNFNYIDQFIDVQKESTDRWVLQEAIGRNRAAQLFKKIGYKTIFISSNYIGEQFMDMDLFMKPKMYGLSSFEVMLLQNSMALLVVNQVDIHQLINARLEAVDMLKRTIYTPGPKFVVFYTTLTHWPFVFDAEGNPLSEEEIDYIPDGEKFRHGYADQVVYTHKVLRDLIKAIMDGSEVPPIIVIQGDHGTDMVYDDTYLERNTCPRERFAIMNAYNLPGVDAHINNMITPVNTFRVIFNEYFDAGLNLLQDRSFDATYDYPYIFYDITNRVNDCVLP